MLRRRGKKGIFVAIAFATLALTSVGFSTWIASYQHVVETEQISITVGEVIGASKITLSAAIDDNDSTFCFDAKNDDNVGPIIYMGPSTGGEDLQFTFSVEVTKSSETDVFNGLQLKVVPHNNGEPGDSELIQSFNSMSSGTTPYFNSPFKLDEQINLVDLNGNKATTNEGFEITSSTNGLKTTYTVVTKFSWGSLFENKNPGAIESDADSTKISTWLKNLTTLREKLNDKKFKLIVTHPGAGNEVKPLLNN